MQWWHLHLIPALGKHRQADLCNFEANLLQEIVPEKAPKILEKQNKTKQNKKPQKPRNRLEST